MGDGDSIATFQSNVSSIATHRVQGILIGICQHMPLDSRRRPGGEDVPCMDGVSGETGARRRDGGDSRY